MAGFLVKSIMICEVHVTGADYEEGLLEDNLDQTDDDINGQVGQRGTRWWMMIK